MNSKSKGDLAVAHAITKLYSRGYEVLLPIGDKKPYDLAYDKDGILRKVQVKYAGRYKSGRYSAGLRITGGNQSYNYARKYGDHDFDDLYVHTEDGRDYLIEWTDVKARNEITVDDPKYQKYLI